MLHTDLASWDDPAVIQEQMLVACMSQRQSTGTSVGLEAPICRMACIYLASWGDPAVIQDQMLVACMSQIQQIVKGQHRNMSRPGGTKCRDAAYRSCLLGRSCSHMRAKVGCMHVTNPACHRPNSCEGQHSDISWLEGTNKQNAVYLSWLVG